MFAGSIGRISWETGDSGDSSHVDDDAVVLFCHLLQLIFHAKKHTGKIDVYQTAPVLLRIIAGAGFGTESAGVVDGEIQTAKFLNRLYHYFLYVPASG